MDSELKSQLDKLARACPPSLTDAASRLDLRALVASALEKTALAQAKCLRPWRD